MVLYFRACRRATSHNSYKHRRRPNAQLLAKRLRTEDGGPCSELSSAPDGIAAAVPPLGHKNACLCLISSACAQACENPGQQPGKDVGSLRRLACCRRLARQSRRTGRCGVAEAVCSATWRLHWHSRAQALRGGPELLQAVANALVELARMG